MHTASRAEKRVRARSCFPFFSQPQISFFSSPRGRQTPRYILHLSCLGEISPIKVAEEWIGKKFFESSKLNKLHVLVNWSLLSHIPLSVSQGTAKDVPYQNIARARECQAFKDSRLLHITVHTISFGFDSNQAEKEMLRGPCPRPCTSARTPCGGTCRWTFFCLAFVSINVSRIWLCITPIIPARARDWQFTIPSSRWSLIMWKISSDGNHS